MKIALVHHKNPDNIRAFSGISHYMTRAIKDEFPTAVEFNLFSAPAVNNELFKGDFRQNLMSFGTCLNRYIKRNNVSADFIFCQGGNAAIPFYRGDIPVFYWNDSTWNSYLSGYQTHQKFKEFKKEYPNLYYWDRKALDRADLILFSSDYVAEACLCNYKIPARKIKVVPFGANLASAPTNEILKQSLTRKLDNNVLNLTFLGKDWQRKGLPVAYQLTRKLNMMGIATKLNVIGCQPAKNYLRDNGNIKIYGRFNKQLEQDMVKFNRILESTHFLIHPAKSEPFGIALCEANAYGIPVIGTDVEGLNTIIVDGRNGYKFPHIRFLSDASEIIMNLFKDKQAYETLSLSSNAEFKERLNWKTNVVKVKELLEAYT